MPEITPPQTPLDEDLPKINAAPYIIDILNNIERMTLDLANWAQAVTIRDREAGTESDMMLACFDQLRQSYNGYAEFKRRIIMEQGLGGD